MASGNAPSKTTRRRRIQLRYPLSLPVTARTQPQLTIVVDTPPIQDFLDPAFDPARDALLENLEAFSVAQAMGSSVRSPLGDESGVGTPMGRFDVVYELSYRDSMVDLEWLPLRTMPRIRSGLPQLSTGADSATFAHTKTVGDARRLGRPRLYDDATERQLLLDATLRIIQRSGYTVATVVDIIEGAGLSRRAFYRHFDTKDAAVRAVYDNEAEKVLVRLRKAVSSAQPGQAALEAWVVTYLNMFTNPPQRKRVEALGSDAFRRTAGYAAEMQRIDAAYVASLVVLLDQARTAGEITAFSPTADAPMIYAVVRQAGMNLLQSPRPLRSEALAQVRRYCWPALGLTLADAE